MMRKNRIAWTYLLLVTLFAAGGVTAAPVDCTVTATTGVPELECNALVALYDATNGAGWLDSSNWKTDTAISTWFGVSVAGARVTNLDLSENNLVGTIPSELGNLASLQMLHLYRNTLSGSIPPELGNLSALKELLLGYNELDGAVPPQLGDLANLIHLTLKENQLTGTIPPDLGDLTNLRSLDLYNNQLTGPIPTELGLLENLEDLFLESNQLTDVLPAELGNLDALVTLQASDNHLEGPIPDTFNALDLVQVFRVQRNHLDADINGDAIISPALQTWYDAILTDNKDISAQTPAPPPGVTIDPVVGLVTTEAGGTASFSVMLDTRPTADVTINLTSSDLTEGSVSPGVLVFTPLNWFIQQTVVIQGLDDLIEDGNQAYTVTSSVSSADSNYDGIDADDVSALNADDEEIGITVSPISGLVTTEAGGAATFSVLLNTQPASDVRIDLSSTDTGEGTINFTSLVFTSSDWNTAQTVTITGVDDPAIDGDQAYQVITSPAVSDDPIYQGIDPDDVNVINIDSDSNQDGAGITVSPAGGLITTEAGGTANFTVVLNTEPGANVALELSSSDTGEGVVSPASLAFTPGNWDTAQTVTITGVDDAANDGDQSYQVITSPAVSADTTYNGIDPLDVDVVNRHNDAGVSFSPPTGLTTTESGDTDTLSVMLDRQPTADVNLNLSSSDTGEGTVDPASLTFTPDNWNVAQTVTLTGVEDLLLDGDQPYTIVTHPVSSTDAIYNGLDPDDVSATNQDNDPEPSCSSPPPDVMLQSSFPFGLYLCIGDSSIKTDPDYIVTIENGAEVYLEAPVVGFNTGFTVEEGAVLAVRVIAPAP